MRRCWIAVTIDMSGSVTHALRVPGRLSESAMQRARAEGDLVVMRYIKAHAAPFRRLDASLLTRYEQRRAN
jgi:hypothetical protein